MRVLVCGTRGHTSHELYQEVVEVLRDAYDPMYWYDLTIIHGACPDSPDEFGDQIGIDFPQVAISRYPADWAAHGRSAGYARNDAMVRSDPDLTVAVWDGRSKGTLDTIGRSVRRGIPVRIVPTGGSE